MRRRGAVGGLIFATIFILSGCGLLSTAYTTYRYRLTVEVDTPDGLRTGSNVIEVRGERNGPNVIDSPSLLLVHVRGEAVAVDLPNGKTLFALLRSDRSVEWAGLIMLIVNPISNRPNKNQGRDNLHYSQMLANKALIVLPRPASAIDNQSDPKSIYPMLVHFSDIHNPKSIETVDPNNLGTTFGAGVKLRRITVQLTEDAVTTGIEKRLVALDILPGHGLDDNFKPTPSPTLAQKIGYRDFRTEYQK